MSNENETSSEQLGGLEMMSDGSSVDEDILLEEELDIEGPNISEEIDEDLEMDGVDIEEVQGEPVELMQEPPSSSDESKKVNKEASKMSEESEGKDSSASGNPLVKKALIGLGVFSTIAMLAGGGYYFLGMGGATQSSVGHSGFVPGGPSPLVAGLPAGASVPNGIQTVPAQPSSIQERGLPSGMQGTPPLQDKTGLSINSDAGANPATASAVRTGPDPLAGIDGIGLSGSSEVSDNDISNSISTQHEQVTPPDVSSEVKELASMLSSLQEQIASMEGKMGGSFNILKNQVDKLNASQASLMSSESTKSEQAVSALKKEISDKDAVIDSQKKKIREFEELINQSYMRILSLKKEIDALKKKSRAVAKKASAGKVKIQVKDLDMQGWELIGVMSDKGVFKMPSGRPVTKVVGDFIHGAKILSVDVNKAQIKTERGLIKMSGR